MSTASSGPASPRADGDAPASHAAPPRGTHEPVRGAVRGPGALEGVWLVLARELGAWFDSSAAYVTTIAGLALSTSLFMNEFFLAGKLDMTPFFDLLPPLFVFFLPAITMRLWSEDLRTRTFELWLTLPLSPLQVVLGKYLAALALHALFLAGTLPIVAMLVWLGEPDLGRIAAGYLGALLLGALLLALGALASSCTADQVVAFLIAALGAFALLVTGEERVVAVLDGLAPGLALGRRLADGVSALPHYEAFVRGVVGLPAVLYFAGLAAAFLALNARVVRTRRA